MTSFLWVNIFAYRPVGTNDAIYFMSINYNDIIYRLGDVADSYNNISCCNW